MCICKIPWIEKKGSAVAVADTAALLGKGGKVPIMSVSILHAFCVSAGDTRINIREPRVTESVAADWS
jgi:hypothetical protein